MARKESPQPKQKSRTRENRPHDLEPGSSWGEVARQVWLAGLGVMVTTGEEGSRLFHQLVERGRAAEPGLTESWERVRDDVQRRVRELARKEAHEEERVESSSEESEELRRHLESLGVPTHEEIAELARKMDDLVAHLEQVLHHSETPPGGPSERH